MTSGLASTLYSVAVIAAVLLAAGGIKLIAARCDRTKGVLMLIAGLVLLGNVLILTL
ncbi:MAG: hypothetical protein M3Q15_07025 [Pseudomonadota bacterium]|nr:hypothetical protein [Pseudomonadota bacterium]